MKGKGKGKVTERKRWPNECDWVRQDCLSISRVGRQALNDAANEISSPNALRLILKAIDAFREIETKLIAVKNGATDERE